MKSQEIFSEKTSGVFQTQEIFFKKTSGIFQTFSNKFTFAIEKVLNCRTMKFRKKFSKWTEEMLPDWRDKYLDYKDLKKQLKLIYPSRKAQTNKRRRLDREAKFHVDCKDEMAKKVSVFEAKLEDEVKKFNGFVMLKEEEYNLKWMALKEIAATPEDPEELMKIHKEVVDFHGEMVLLQSYSALNYIGLVKILKKYDKRSGAVTRSPFMWKLVQQPFFSTKVLNKLVSDCEITLDHLFSEIEVLLEMNDSESDGDHDPGRAPKKSGELEHVESKHMKLALLVLQTLQEIRSGSSTLGAHSLPPMQI